MYREIIFRVDNSDEFDTLEKIVKEISNDFEFSGRRSAVRFPNWVFINILKDNGKYKDIVVWSVVSDIDGFENYLSFRTDYINPHIFTSYDFHKLRGMIIKEPSYKPRKIIRESVEKNLFQTVIFRIDNDDEGKIVQENLFELGFRWAGGMKSFLSFGRSSFPIYFFAADDNHHKSIRYLKDYPNDDRVIIYLKNKNMEDGRKVIEQVFDYNESKNTLQLLKYGKLQPSYKPRKIIRESVEDNLFKSVAFRIDNREEGIIAQENLFNFGFEWQSNSSPYHIKDFTSYNFPVHIFANNKTDKSISFLMDYEKDEEVSKYLGRCNQIQDRRAIEHVFSYDDTINVLQLLKYGKLQPSYKPRKIIRESVEGDLFRVIIFRIDDERESKIVQENLFESGFGWSPYGTSKLIRNFNFDKAPIYIFANNGSYKYLSFSEDNENNNQMIKYIKMNNIEERKIMEHIFDYNESTKVLQLLKYGTVRIPSYKPRKIIRESIQNKDYYYRFKTEKEFREKYGEYWYEDRIDWDYDRMNYLFGTKLEYDFPDSKNYILIPKINLPNNHWTIDREMLVKEKIVPTVPNYKPRKIIK